MTNFVAAKHNKEELTVDYLADDGSHLLKTGGTVAWRFNNPGNLRKPGKSPDWEKLVIGVGDTKSGKFVIFPSYEIGRKAKFQVLRGVYDNYTIPEMMEKYAPGGENDTAAYSDYVIKKTSLPEDKKLSAMTDGEIESIMSAMEKYEGYDAKQDTRKEQCVSATTITLSDGAKPISNEAVLIKIGDKQYSAKSSTSGLVAPIVHTDIGASVEVFAKNFESRWKEILSFTMNDVSQSFVAVKSEFAATGTTRPDTPTKIDNSKAPVSYVVQPHDTIEKIAKKFNVKAADLKKWNSNIKNISLIFPGQRIDVYGTSSTSTKNSQANKSEAAKAKQEPEKTLPARSKDGEGKAIALITPNQSRALWMEFALSEAKRWAGQTEDVIMEDINYHKELGTKIFPTLAGRNNAWCASFVNWCLKQAGYKTWKIPYRARTVKDDSNFIEIDEPIYGAIVLIGTHHATLAYGLDKKKSRLICLGGNQTDQINFQTYSEKSTFYIPSAYIDFYNSEIKSGAKLDSYDLVDLNKSFGIKVNKKSGGSSTT